MKSLIAGLAFLLFFASPASAHRHRHWHHEARAFQASWGGRPAGCPRAFCGCGASLYVFGRIVPALNLAANWLRFPRSYPAPGAVAANHQHVFVLLRPDQSGRWWVHDSNYGHRTVVHLRSLAGFSVVNPRS